MPAFSAFASAITSALGSATDLSVYYKHAPEDTLPPYVTFARQADQDDYTFTSNGKLADWTVKVVSNRRHPAEALAEYETIHASIQDAALSITGFTAIKFRRSSEFDYQDNERFWHVGGIYDVWARES